MAGKNRVAQYQADRTNQKLYFCRLACKAAAETVDRQIYQAHCETAIFHLHGALLAFLQELSQFYELNLSQPTIKEIEELLCQRTQVSPEIQRLTQLIEGGFLASVLMAYQRCQYAPKLEALSAQQFNQQDNDAAMVGMVKKPNDLILNVVTLSNQWLPDDATIREWRHQFLDLIEQLRAGMVEF